MTESTAFDRLDEHFARVAERDRVPGIAYGLTVGDALVHAGGIGTLRVGEHAAPGADTASRICSMTKSFVAAALLALRDEGRLALDDPVAEHVPEVGSLEPPTTDSPAITIRHLMSMASGMPEDDNWADRHMDLSASAVDAIFRQGATFAHAPGVAFEYSNLGWVMLGRVITNVAGVPAQEFVNERIVRPLELSSTTWRPPAGPDRMTGYRLLDGTWHEETAPLDDGDFAPMAGLWSTVSDLSRWIAFMLDAYPPRDDPDAGPLSRSSRREMQQVHRGFPSEYEAETGRLTAGGYGLGLTAFNDLRFGSMLGHAGGLPGFGSFMRWLPDHGVGVVALANLTYAPMRIATLEALEVLDDLGALPAKRSRAASSGLIAARDGLTRLVDRWDDGLADELFAMNVLLDDARDRRRDQAVALRERLGVVSAGELTVESATRGSFVLQGEVGEATVHVMLSPEVPPRIQWYEVDGLGESSP